MNEVTRILNGVAAGDGAVNSRLIALVYDELRQMARNQLRNEAPGQTLQATALVHEAFLRLTNGTSESTPAWQSRAHFFGAAAEAMRRILVDAARRRQALKRGRHIDHQDADDLAVSAVTSDEEALEVHEVLDKLAQTDAMAAQLVKLRFYAGLSAAESAEVLGMPVRTAHDLWSYARAWLRQELRPTSE